MVLIGLQCSDLLMVVPMLYGSGWGRRRRNAEIEDDRTFLKTARRVLHASR